MPTVNLSFLHRPLPGLAAFSFVGAVEWFLAGLRIIAPARVQGVRWRALYQFIPAKERRDVTDRLCIERSWLGVRRFTPMSGCGEARPRAIELSNAQVLLTDLELPSAARHDLREAISHRLEELSPLPADEVQFVASPPRPCTADRIALTVAIVRKSTVERLLGAPDGGRIGLIGAAPNADGKFDYVFYENRSVPQLDRKSMLRWGALVLSAFVLSIGVDRHLDRRMEAALARETALLEILRAEHQSTRFLRELPPVAPQRIAPAMIEVSLDELSGLLPDETWVEQVSLTPGSVAAEGYARRSTRWNDKAAPSLIPSDRPEIDRFTIRIERVK